MRAIAACLLLLCACARPKAWPEQVRAALPPVSGGRDFEAGFRNGADMVHEALKSGIRPFRPVLDRAAPPPRLLGPAPEGLEAPRPLADLDLDTGLLVVSVAGGGAFARGQVQGFDWALGAVGQGLVRPMVKPAPPADWSPWEERLTLASGSRSMDLRWAPGLLAWSLAEAGFPPRRGWRPWSDPAPPAWAALTGDVLWAQTRGGLALSIDLASGGIMEVRPGSAHAAPNDLEAFRASAEREFRSAAFQEELAGLRDRAGTGGIPAILAVGRRLRGMGEVAEAEAYAWFRKAAELGDPMAMLDIGVRLHHGNGVPADRTASALWLERAAAAGLPQAAAVRTMLEQAPSASAGSPAPPAPAAAPPPR